MVRTTVDISDEILRQAKSRAVADAIPLRRVFESALKFYLSKPGSRAPFKLRWHTEHGRLRPGVRLDSREELLDLMEDRR